MNFRVTVDVSRRGDAEATLGRILRGLAAARGGGKSVKVGLPAGKAPGDLVAIALYNHEGTSRGIPPRPFITRAFYQGRGELRAFLRAEARGLLTGRVGLDQVLPRLGLWGQRAIQDQIKSSVPPPNAASTIRQKGSSTTLIDTGRLVQSITWAVE